MYLQVHRESQHTQTQHKECRREIEILTGEKKNTRRTKSVIPGKTDRYFLLHWVAEKPDRTKSIWLTLGISGKSLKKNILDTHTESRTDGKFSGLWLFSRIRFSQSATVLRLFTKLLCFTKLLPRLFWAKQHLSSWGKTLQFFVFANYNFALASTMNSDLGTQRHPQPPMVCQVSHWKPDIGAVGSCQHRRWHWGFLMVFYWQCVIFHFSI